MNQCVTKMFRLPCRNLHSSNLLNQVRTQTRMRVVDNSEIGMQAMAEGKPPKVINVYNLNKVGCLGDKILVAIKGEKMRGIVVGCVKQQNPNIPSFDTNNMVLIANNGSPIGTRINVPIPHVLRTMLKTKAHVKSADYSKLIAIASSFV